MRKNLNVIVLVGAVGLFDFSLISALAFAEFSPTKLPGVLIDIRSWLVVVGGFVAAMFVPGAEQAVKSACSPEYRSRGRDLEGDIRALEKAFYVIWAFAIGCSILNFIIEMRTVNDERELILRAAMMAAYPIAYGIILGNLVILNMAANLRKASIVGVGNYLCFRCGAIISEPTNICHDCTPKQEEYAKKLEANKKTIRQTYKIIAALGRIAAFVLLALTYLYSAMSFYVRHSISLWLTLYFLTMYFISLSRVPNELKKEKPITPVLYLIAFGMANAFGNKSFLAPSLWFSVIMMMLFSIPVGLVKPEIVLLGKSKSRILAVVIYAVLLILSILPSKNPTINNSMDKYAEWQAEAGEKFNQESEIRNPQKDSLHK